MERLRLHQSAISALKIREPRLQTRGFRKNLLSFLEKRVKKEYEVYKEECETSEDIDDGEYSLEDAYLSIFSIRMLRYDFGFIPDAYVIDEDKEEILIFEIEDTHVMKGKKAWYLVNLAHSIWWDLNFDVRLFVADRYANTKELDVNLLHAGMLEEFGSLIVPREDGEKYNWLTMYEGMQQVKRPVRKCHNCGRVLPLELYEGHVKNCGEKAAF